MIRVSERDLICDMGENNGLLDDTVVIGQFDSLFKRNVFAIHTENAWHFAFYASRGSLNN